MIWGKTYQEQSKVIVRCVKRFAWWPIKLVDGRHVWWQYIWAKELEQWGCVNVDYYFESPE